MKSIKLSPFAMANYKSMTPAQVRSVDDAILKLRSGGIHTAALEITRLPSKQGYVVKAKSGTRLTVVHEGGGHLLVDDVFAITSPAAKKPSGAAITAKKSASGSVKPNAVKPSVTGSSTHGRGGDTARRTTSAKKTTAKKATAAKTA